MNAVATIARFELTAAARQKWVRLLGVAFAAMTVAVAHSVGALEELGAPEGLARTTVSLVPLVLLLVPLASLLLGVTGHAGEPGSEAYLFTQPVTRGQVLFGRWLGEFAALTVSLAAGFGAGAAILAFLAGASELPRFLFFVFTAILLGAAFLAIAAAVSAFAPRRTVALGLAAFVWFFFVLLYDSVALGLAGWVTGRMGGRVLFLSVFGNPADLVRVLALSIAGTPHVLGAAGDSWSLFLGGPGRASALALAALFSWTALSLERARRKLRRRDL